MFRKYSDIVSTPVQSYAVIMPVRSDEKLFIVNSLHRSPVLANGAKLKGCSVIKAPLDCQVGYYLDADYNILGLK